MFFVMWLAERESDDNVCISMSWLPVSESGRYNFANKRERSTIAHGPRRTYVCFVSIF